LRFGRGTQSVARGAMAKQTEPDLDVEVEVRRAGRRVIVIVDLKDEYDAMILIDSINNDFIKLGHTALVIGQCRVIEW
jgi:hypothetical protein